MQWPLIRRMQMSLAAAAYDKKINIIKTSQNAPHADVFNRKGTIRLNGLMEYVICILHLLRSGAEKHVH